MVYGESNEKLVKKLFCVGMLRKKLFAFDKVSKKLHVQAESRKKFDHKKPCPPPPHIKWSAPKVLIW